MYNSQIGGSLSDCIFMVVLKGLYESYFIRRDLIKWTSVCPPFFLSLCKNVLFKIHDA